VSEQADNEQQRSSNSREPCSLNESIGLPDDLSLEDAAHLERLAVVGQLCAEMAHEVSQPLAAIRMFAEAALHKIKEPTPEHLAQIEEALANIYVQASRMQQITGRIHGAARTSSERREPVALNEVLDSVLPLVETLSDRYGVDFDLQIPDPAPRLLADRVQLEQVLLNIMRNAVEAVALQPEERRRVTLRARLAGGFVEIDISDRGEGIAPENLPRVFDRYFTTREGGTGLGLYIVREIVRAHGGQIGVAPNPDGGVTFHIRWPAAP